MNSTYVEKLIAEYLADDMSSAREADLRAACEQDPALLDRLAGAVMTDRLLRHEGSGSEAHHFADEVVYRIDQKPAGRELADRVTGRIEAERLAQAPVLRALAAAANTPLAESASNLPSQRSMRIGMGLAAAACLILSVTVFMMIRLHLARHEIELAKQPSPRLSEPMVAVALPEIQQANQTPASATPAVATPETASVEPFRIALARLHSIAPGMTVIRQGQAAEAVLGQERMKEIASPRALLELFDPNAITVTGPSPIVEVRFDSLRATDDSSGCRYADRLDRETGAKHIELISGSALCRVSKQMPDRPLTLNTALASYTVLGTTFAVRSGEAMSRLEVTEGRVRVKGSGDAASVVATAGQFMVALPGTDLIHGSLPPVPVVRVYSAPNVLSHVLPAEPGPMVRLVDSESGVQRLAFEDAANLGDGDYDDFFIEVREVNGLRKYRAWKGSAGFRFDVVAPDGTVIARDINSAGVEFEMPIDIAAPAADPRAAGYERRDREFRALSQIMTVPE